MKKKIYIAGKISGLPQQEVIEKFAGLQSNLEHCGFEVLNPLEIVGTWNVTWEAAMKKCIKALVDCDAVYLMDCHTQSTGAMIELELAKSLKIPCANNLISLIGLWNN
jgi:nucleoside 2-deoxyribosyltransferase